MANVKNISIDGTSYAIPIPTKTSELTNDSGYTTNTGTVTQVKVGTTAYNPSSGVVSLPAYPTVNNATLTIQKNGTNVQTFTANQSSNATANITVPTKTSEITNDSDFTTFIPKNGTVSTGSTITNGQTYTIPSDGWYLVSMAMTQVVPNASTDILFQLLVKNGSNEVGIFSHDITGLQQYGFFNMGMPFPFKKDTVLKWGGTASYTSATIYKLT